MSAFGLPVRSDPHRSGPSPIPPPSRRASSRTAWSPAIRAVLSAVLLPDLRHVSAGWLGAFLVGGACFATPYTPSSEIVVDPGTRYLDAGGFRTRLGSIRLGNDVLLSFTGAEPEADRWVRTDGEGYALEPLTSLSGNVGRVVECYPETETFATLLYHPSTGLRFARIEDSGEPELAGVVLDPSGTPPTQAWIVPTSVGYRAFWRSGDVLYTAHVDDNIDLVGGITTLSEDVGDVQVETGADGTIVGWAGSDGTYARTFTFEGALDPHSFFVPVATNPNTRVAVARQGDFALLFWSNSGLVRQARLQVSTGIVLGESDLPLPANGDLAASATSVEYTVASSPGESGPVRALRIDSSGVPLGSAIVLGAQNFYGLGRSVSACATDGGTLVTWINGWTTASPESNRSGEFFGGPAGRAENDCGWASWLSARRVGHGGALGPLHDADATHEPSVTIPWFVGEDLRAFTTSESGSALETVSVARSGEVALLDAEVYSTHCEDDVEGGVGAVQDGGIRVVVKDRRGFPSLPYYTLIVPRFGPDGQYAELDTPYVWSGTLYDTPADWDVAIDADTAYVAIGHRAYPDSLWIAIRQFSTTGYGLTRSAIDVTPNATQTFVSTVGGEPTVFWTAADGVYSASARSQTDEIAEGARLLEADSATLHAVQSGDPGAVLIFSGAPIIEGVPGSAGTWMLFLGETGTVESGPFDLGIPNLETARVCWTGSEYFLVWQERIGSTRRDVLITTMDHGADPGVLAGLWVSQDFVPLELFLAISDGGAVAVTYGDRIRFFDPDPSAVPAPPDRFATGWSILPNPSREDLRLRFERAMTGPVEVTLVDSRGRVVGEMTFHNVTSGEGVDLGSLVRGQASGTYWVRVRTTTGVTSRTVQRIR